MKWTGLFGLCLSLLTAKAQVPSFGTAERIDLASWNLMWYGHAVYGSTDKPVQRNALAEVLRNAQIDIWFFQEICDTSDFSALLKESGPFQQVYSDYWQTQKTAWVWDTSQWTLLYSSVLFHDKAQDFASGRLPLLSVLKAKNSPDTLFLVGVHLKAHTGTAEQQVAAWNNRKASAGHLVNWLEGMRDRKVIIAGDWNDGIDKSIHNDTLSPFTALREAGYFILEKQVLAGERTWYYGTACIDHIWVNERAKEELLMETARILPLDWYFGHYPEQVSDHFPVFGAFKRSVTTGIPGEKPGRPLLFPNPSKGIFYIDGSKEASSIHLVDMLGKPVLFIQEREGDHLLIRITKQGIYSLFMQGGGQVFVYRLVVNP